MTTSNRSLRPATTMMALLLQCLLLLSPPAGMLSTTTMTTILVLAGTTPEGLEFLKQKEAEEGVIKLPSGLLYKELNAGTGSSPEAKTPCSCHYTGMLMDGTEFDSSYKRGTPATFAPNQVIKGWTEAMQLMREGSKWELYIPSELAYGDRGAGTVIPGGAVLIFTLELLKVNSDPQTVARDDYEEEEDDDDWDDEEDDEPDFDDDDDEYYDD